ncbi:hypothetical protein NKK52_15195 [Mesorhizobium sp. C277A]|uniref:hypothetical protein n=1 Tax=unclassified Mesorhizobium TaxID=325217 RepID=UPI0003CE4D28|nr:MULTISPECIES: hypothetical protein [unclassified Mesorhizobium]ESW73461.1 hypothetical protein X771_01095 [Mesorhizobium sp. LSJC277A00]ESW89201.1 hypothetical protein X773_03425 [Mesorhizobium sp. LSJC285A00]ESY05231.1 hypothetical protein X753_16920 [Mesorhizobium sp. LNJC399B00]WJI70365.1 hypothetical protein NLY36_06060 [Mesorhizobium sp. C399B]
MKPKLANQVSGQRIFVVVLDLGEEAFAALTAFATDQNLGSASLTAIGAFGAALIDLDA